MYTRPFFYEKIIIEKDNENVYNVLRPFSFMNTAMKKDQGKIINT